MTTTQTLMSSRQTFSEVRLAELRKRVANIPAIAKLPGLTIFAAGSYGRLEASEFSDIDLFFIYEGNPAEIENRRTEELRLFGALIAIADDMGFPAFSNDSQYLTTSSCDELLEQLGSPKDDDENHFTLRMLMMLESRPISGDEAYKGILNRVFESYYRDYPDHQASFQPFFLLNDVSRFWKTLLLNYENKRNQKVAERAKAKQKVRNFKLKFSRMTTCFATVAALGSLSDPIDVAKLLELIEMTPRQRLEYVAKLRPECGPIVEKLIEEYAWFMELTGMDEPALTDLFEDKAKRSELFNRANAYGTTMYELLAAIDSNSGGPGSQFIRYLVI